MAKRFHEETTTLELDSTECMAGGNSPRLKCPKDVC